MVRVAYLVGSILVRAVAVVNDLGRVEWVEDSLALLLLLEGFDAICLALGLAIVSCDRGHVLRGSREKTNDKWLRKHRAERRKSLYISSRKHQDFGETLRLTHTSNALVRLRDKKGRWRARGAPRDPYRRDAARQSACSVMAMASGLRWVKVRQDAA
jgi:hypothetical protein